MLDFVSVKGEDVRFCQCERGKMSDFVNVKGVRCQILSV